MSYLIFMVKNGIEILQDIIDNMLLYMFCIFTFMKLQYIDNLIKDLIFEYLKENIDIVESDNVYLGVNFIITLQ